MWIKKNDKPLRHTSLLGLLFVLFCLTTTCTQSSICDNSRQESPHPGSGLHLISEEKVRWQSIPPLSGPHLPIAPKGGVWNNPIPPLQQVAFLEKGGVIIHYGTKLEISERLKLTSFSTSSTLIAPNPELSNQEGIVLTAWTWKLECTSVDSEKISKFINKRSKQKNLLH